MAKGLRGHTFPPATDGRPTDTNAELSISDTPRTDTPRAEPLSAMATADMRGPSTQSFQVKGDSSPGGSPYPTPCLPRREEPVREPDPAPAAMPPVLELSGHG